MKKRNTRKFRMLRLTEGEVIEAAESAMSQFDMPDDALIVGAQSDFLTGTINFKVLSDTFEEVKANFLPQDVEKKAKGE